ncbi:Adenylosuccinate synthetase [hydrothermal vent metagenome]|uniref:Adenylosuccinate synthetase n=1 Tax=hydrothermal vent metagenome TaxID=652676 RepID=A0A3B1D2E3_9ZZZZ
MNLIVIGTQWGDEGKGKIVDLLSEDADYVVRYQGGHNAGHTIVIGDKKIVLHLIPTGLLQPGKTGVIGNGVVINPEALLQEIATLSEENIDVSGRLFISETAHLIMPYHQRIDLESEKTKGAQKIGTTGRGIGPAYADKMARNGIRVCDLYDPERFRKKLETNLKEINLILEQVYQVEAFDPEDIFKEYLVYAEKIKPYVVNTSLLLNQAIDDDKQMLFEGAQGTHLDVDHGTYPFVTSSNSGAGGASTGTGVGPTRFDEVLGVTKAYTTRVGSGPFPAELTDQMGETLREKGGEFGATTGRPRRCGWFDALQVRQTVRINHMTSLALTKLDVLDGIPEISICVGYEVDGKVLDEMPTALSHLEKAKPVLKHFSGWTESTYGVTDYEKLPKNAKAYLEAISSLVACRIDIISTSSKRGETIVLRNPFTDK